MKNSMRIFMATALAGAIVGALGLSSCRPDPDKPQFTVIEHSETIPGEHGVFEFDYRFEYISWYGDEAAMQKIRTAQLTDFFGAEFVRTDPRESARAFDLTTVEANTWGGYLKIRSWSDVIRDRIVTFTVERAEYTGGAHGMETTEYANFDLSTGARLSLDDLFTPEGKTALAENIRSQILKDNGLATWDELMEKSCFNAAGEFSATENFLLSEEHIIFMYNPYDIACYAAGSTKVRLSLADLAGFKKDMLGK